jgi:hypothetical protein
MKIRIKNLIPYSCDFSCSNKKISKNNKTVGKIIKFIKTKDGIDAIGEITDIITIKEIKGEI